MTEEERARRRDDFLATLYAAADTPDLIPTLADEYINEYGYPAKVGEVVRIPKPCTRAHYDDVIDRKSEKSRCFWFFFIASWAISVIFIGSIAIHNFSGWMHQDPSLSVGWLGQILTGTLVGGYLFGKFIAFWKYAE